ncbi:hypothetical protein IT409_02005 [Candidatus Falkowbacteria bacterium]|nr:hypothetical protein [Candidatus Falkowbacteria bacterium]
MTVVYPLTGMLPMSALRKETDNNKNIPPLGSAYAPPARPYSPSWQIRANQLGMSPLEWQNGGYKSDGWETPYVVKKQTTKE